MVIIKDKITGKLVDKGNIINESSVQIKIDKSNKWYKKSNYIIERIILIIVVSISLFNCKSVKEYSKKDIDNIKKTDSIKKVEMLMLEIDYKEEYK